MNCYYLCTDMNLYYLCTGVNCYYLCTNAELLLSLHQCELLLSLHRCELLLSLHRCCCYFLCTDAELLLSLHRCELLLSLHRCCLCAVCRGLRVERPRAYVRRPRAAGRTTGGQEHEPLGHPQRRHWRYLEALDDTEERRTIRRARRHFSAEKSDDEYAGTGQTGHFPGRLFSLR